MTLIVGLNLSDRLYIAGDTRVSFSDGTYKDDIIKVAILNGEPIKLIGKKNPNVISMAVAGNLKLAKYLYDKITEGISKKILSTEIRELLKNIENYTKDMMSARFNDGNTYNESNCCIIFAGMTDNEKKKINSTQLKKLKGIFNKNIASNDELEKVKIQLENNDIFKKLSEKVSINNLLSFYNEPYAKKINPLIQKAIDENKEIIEAPDSLVFSLSIRGNAPIEINKAERGEFLAFGTNGITKDDLPEDFLAQMELSPGQQTTQGNLMETGIIRDYIIGIAKKNNITKIGGIVTPITLKENLYEINYLHHRSTLEGQNIENVYQLKEEIFFRKGNETPIKLKSFYDYNIGSSSVTL